jgi:hypothetical protein
VSALPPPLVPLFRNGDTAGRHLDVDLPPGRVVHATEGDRGPALWLSDAPPPPGLWARLRAAHAGSGLWPLLLEALSSEASRPWEVGELWPGERSVPDQFSADAVLAELWADHTAGEDDDEGDDDEKDEEDEPSDALAPFGTRWPGRAARPTPLGPPDETADEFADEFLSFKPTIRLGLVAADRGADALAVAGWMGPANYTNDMGRLAAVLRDWEERFGARVVGVGFDELYLTVAAPPQTTDEAIGVAAEHFAFCPDNVWQGRPPYTLRAYAERIVGRPVWTFWWD